MTIPPADELREIFAAAREHGVTHLRVGSLEVRLALAPAPPTPAHASEGEALVAAINGASPLPGEDPVATLRREADRDLKRTLEDPLEVISSGGRLLQDVSVGS